MPGIDGWVGAEPHDPESFGGDIHFVMSCAAGMALGAAVIGQSSVTALADDSTIIVLVHNADDPPEQTWAERIRVVDRMIGIG